MRVFMLLRSARFSLPVRIAEVEAIPTHLLRGGSRDSSGWTCCSFEVLAGVQTFVCFRVQDFSLFDRMRGRLVWRVRFASQGCPSADPLYQRQAGRVRH